MPRRSQVEVEKQPVVEAERRGLVLGEEMGLGEEEMEPLEEVQQPGLVG